jgi:hypothetical protein
MIKLPYARADFGLMMREKCFYVDRTNYLEQLEVYAPVYTMFLRPRRFGKSLWISLLEHYYDVNKAAEFPTFIWRFTHWTQSNTVSQSISDFTV